MTLNHELFIQMSASGETIKLCDFGISRNPKAGTLTSQSTQSIGGTTRWRAPETFGYPPNWTKEADVFSLSMTFYEIITKNIPFEDEHDDFRVESHLRNGIRPLFESTSSSPWWFDKMKILIESGWQQEPYLRPSCKKLLKGINLILQEDEARSPIPQSSCMSILFS